MQAYLRIYICEIDSHLPLPTENTRLNPIHQEGRNQNSISLLKVFNLSSRLRSSRLYSGFEFIHLPTQNITLNPIPQSLISKSKVSSSLTLSTLVLLFLGLRVILSPFWSFWIKNDQKSTFSYHNMIYIIGKLITYALRICHCFLARGSFWAHFEARGSFCSAQNHFEARTSKFNFFIPIYIICHWKPHNL